MQKIRRVSKFFQYIFQSLFVILPIILAVFWINAPAPFSAMAADYGFSLSYIPDGLHIMAPLTINTKILGFLICLIPLAVNLSILYFLIRLFKNFARGEMFTVNNVRNIKNIGYAMLIGQIISPIHQALLSAALTWHNPPGYRQVTISFMGTNIGILLAAIIIILIAWIFAEGNKIHEEQQYTV